VVSEFAVCVMMINNGDIDVPHPVLAIVDEYDTVPQSALEGGMHDAGVAHFYVRRHRVGGHERISARNHCNLSAFASVNKHNQSSDEWWWC
jgi:hypothetical protein